MAINSSLPKFYRVKRSFGESPSFDVIAAMDAEWSRLNLNYAITNITNGSSSRNFAASNLAASISTAVPYSPRIAIGVGSRGIYDLPLMVRHLVDLVKAAGAQPFIVPAMGSHGGATAEGQREVLASLGITESTMGCAIEATMETVSMGNTAAGLPAYVDAIAAKADGILLLNRVKMHTSFHGHLESGLHKMLAIGLGKEKAATLLHARGPDGLRDDMPEVARYLLTRLPFLAGFGIVENAYHRTVALRALAAGELENGERELLILAKSLAPALPVEDLDVLVVEKMGKDISGTGMDTNVIGRLKMPGKSEPTSPRIKAIVVLDLTEGTHGNALGMGLADFTTEVMAGKVDFHLTGKNVLASGFLERGRLPLVMKDSAEALDAAIFHAFRDRPEQKNNARILRIASTLDLETFFVSENLVEEMRSLPGYLEDAGPLEWGELD